MIVITNPEAFTADCDTAVTIGKFDGLHKGHMELVDRVLSYREEGLLPVVLCFETKQGILTKEEKTECLRKAGVAVLIFLPLTEAFFHTEAEAFLREVLVKRLRAKKIICGDDFFFGYQRKGNTAFLREREAEYGYRTEVFSKLMFQGQVISSTVIRNALQEGNVILANSMLSEPYHVTGEIVHGRALGRKLGFPTINVYPPEDKLLPAYGVYAVQTRIEDRVLRGLLNFGVKPTVSDELLPLLEVHLFDVSEDLYGKVSTITFLRFIRPERKFSGLSELKAQVDSDLADARKEWNPVDKEK